MTITLEVFYIHALSRNSKILSVRDKSTRSNLEKSNSRFSLSLGL